MTFQVTFQLSVFIALNFGGVLTVWDSGLERKCRLRTVYCPCDGVYNKTTGGFKVGVTYRDCGKQVLCSYRDVFKKCQRVYSVLPRQKRGTSSNEKHIKCFNGTLQTPNSDVGRPSVTINGKARDVRVDDDPSFKCDVYANPAATITWQFNGTKLDRKRVEHSIDACGQTLSLKDVSVENSGTYTCVVENLYGKGTASAKLNVVPQSGPYIEYVDLEGKEDMAYTKSNLNITCKSYNSVQNMFFKSQTAIWEGDNYTYYHSIEGAALITTLEIQHITMEDAGNYTCYAVAANNLRSNKMYILKVGPCPGGSYCLRHGNKALPCEAGTYRKGSSNVTDECFGCLAGHFCPTGSEEPQPCRWGTYMPFNNASAFQDCIICPGVVLSDEGDSAKPAVNGTDCPPVKNMKFRDPEGGLSSSASPLSMFEILGAVTGAVLAVFVLIGVSLYCAMKRRSSLSSCLSKVTTKHQDREWYAGNTVSSHNAELVQPLKNNTDDTANSAVFKAAVEQEYEIHHDVFICYSSKDTSWVKELLEELERRNFSCCIDFRNFVPGAAIVQNITEAIYHSRKTIAVLSPDFVNSDWCGQELQKALTRVRFHQVVPVVYKHCQIPLVLQDRTYLDWENCHVKPYFWQQLERALKNSTDVLL